MKTFGISFAVGATLGASFSGAFGKASKGVAGLSREINNLRNSYKSLEKYESNKKNLQEKIKVIKNTKLAILELKNAMKEEKNQTDVNKKALSNLEKKLVSLNKEFSKESSALRSSAKILKDKKILIESTANSYKKLEDDIKRAELATLRYNKANSANEFAGKVSKAGGTAIKIGAAGLALPLKTIQSAIKAESSFSDVKKQFDFATKEEEAKFKNDLHKIITEKRIAISLEELYAAAASAGQSGLKQDEAVQYIELASKVGMAFDMSREEAAKSMFEIRNALNLPYEKLVKLTDQMNYLGNTTGASAANIVEFVNRVGSIGKIAGFSDGAVGAIGATLIEKGMDTERAATGAKKIFNTLTKGKAVTKKQAGVFAELGINPTELAKLSQKDAEKAMNILFKSISKKSKDEQGAILFQLFGEEGKEAAAKLLTDLDRINENLRKINSNESKGSVEKEADIKRETVQNQLEILKGKSSIIGSQLGTLLLPEVNKVLDTFSKLLTKVLEFQQANPDKIRKYFKIFTYGMASLLGFGSGLKMVSGAIKLYAGYMQVAGFMTEHKFGTKLFSTGKKVIGVFGKMASGMKSFGLSLLANPLTWYIAGILAIVAAGYLLYKNWDKIKEKTAELRTKVTELIDKYWFLMGPIGWLIKAGMTLYRNWDDIKEKAVQIKEKVTDMVVRAIENWSTFKTATKESLGAVFTWIEEKWEGVKEKGQQVLDFFLEIFRKIKDGISDAFDTVKGWFTSEPKNTPSSRKLPGYARGGIVSRPTLAWIGEGASSESIIPHDNSQSSFNLWEKTGRLIGAYEKINSTDNSVNIEFNFNPVIHANNTTGVREEIDRAKTNAFEEFKKLMERYNRENRRLGYGR